MATEKTTVMVIKADLQCPCCYKKLKKLLCKFPQIRDQMYDEKANEVTITVVCCSPEKIRDKLCSKGGKIIKTIDIKDPPKKPNPPPQKPKEAPKPKEPEKPKEAPKPPPKEPEKPKEAPKPPPKEPEKPKEAPKPPPKEPEKPKEAPKPQEAPKPKPTPPPPQKPSGPAQFPEPIKMMPPQELFPAHGFPQAVPTGCCCGPCYNGLSGGPCYYGGGGGGGGYYGRPVPPPPTYDYNYGRPCYALRSCDEYFNEENPQGCFIM